MAMQVFPRQYLTEVWSVIYPTSQQVSITLVPMDSLGFLVSYDTGIFTLALKRRPLQPKNCKLH